MYIIQEIQTNENQTALVTPITKENWNEAISAFHQAASYAAVSSVKTHTVMLYDERGEVIERITFDHPVE